METGTVLDEGKSEQPRLSEANLYKASLSAFSYKFTTLINLVKTIQYLLIF